MVLDIIYIIYFYFYHGRLVSSICNKIKIKIKIKIIDWLPLCNFDNDSINF